MFKYKVILTAAVLAVFMLISFVNSSDAFEIVEFQSDTEDYSYNGYTYHMAYAKTSAPYYTVEWYINEVRVAKSYGDSNNPKTYAHFYPYDKIPGCIKGTKWTIKAIAYPMDDDNPNGATKATESYIVRMFEPIVISGKKTILWEKPTVTGVYGYNELSRHYFDGTDIIMDGYVYASNMTDNICEMSAWFRHTNLATGGWTEHGAPTEDIGPDPEDKGIKRTYGPYYTDSSILNYHVGRPIGRDETYSFNVHIHLVANGNGTTDTWHGIDDRFDNEFTEEDNP